MAVVGGEGGAKFIGGVRFLVIDKRFVGERILFFFIGETFKSWRQFGVRGSPLLLNFLGEFGKGAHTTFVRTDETLGSRAA